MLIPPQNFREMIQEVVRVVFCPTAVKAQLDGRRKSAKEMQKALGFGKERFVGDV